MTVNGVAGVAAVVVGAAGLVTYAGLSAQSQIFGRVMIAGRDPGEIALTYDDGPNDVVTERLLDVLDAGRVRASFFLIGRFVRERPEIARAVTARGHVVGNHTMRHPWLAWQTARQVRQELADCNATIEDVLGQRVRFFRAPHGARRPVVLRIAREMGMVPVQWNTLPGDWKAIGAEEIARRTATGIERNRRAGRGSNVVLHDGGHLALGADRMRTVEATRMVIERFSEMRFVTVERWA